MPVHLLDWARVERNLPQRSCKHCAYDFKGSAVEGDCPECGAEYGFFCRHCDYPLVGRPFAGKCPECGCEFDKSNDRKVLWKSGVVRGGEAKRFKVVTFVVVAVVIPALAFLLGLPIADWIRNANQRPSPRMSFAGSVGITAVAFGALAYGVCIVGIGVGLLASRR